jgi:hypothetical protein
MTLRFRNAVALALLSAEASAQEQPLVAILNWADGCAIAPVAPAANSLLS